MLPTQWPGPLTTSIKCIAIFITPSVLYFEAQGKQMIDVELSQGVAGSAMATDPARYRGRCLRARYLKDIPMFTRQQIVALLSVSLLSSAAYGQGAALGAADTALLAATVAPRALRTSRIEVSKLVIRSNDSRSNGG